VGQDWCNGVLFEMLHDVMFVFLRAERAPTVCHSYVSCCTGLPNDSQSAEARRNHSTEKIGVSTSFATVVYTLPVGPSHLHLRSLTQPRS
jgi:hypothetical protein